MQISKYITLIFLGSLFFCTPKEPVGFNCLPAIAQFFLTDYFLEKIDYQYGLSVDESEDDGSYFVSLSYGTEIVFNAVGEWTSITLGASKTEMPEGILELKPFPVIISYVDENYPDSLIRILQRSDSGYVLTIINSDDAAATFLDLKFDLFGVPI